MTVAGYFFRGRRQLSLLAAEPGVERICKAVLYCGGALLLCAIPAGESPLPLGAAAVAASPFGWALAAALGAGAGYFLFWGAGAGPGFLWTAAALLLALGRRLTGEQRLGVPALCLGLLAGSAGAVFSRDPPMLLIWSAAAFAGVLLLGWLQKTMHPLALWMTFSLGIRALAAAGLPVMACLAAGALASSGPLPAAALAGTGLEAAGLPGMTAGLCAAHFLRTVPLKEPWRRMIGPCAGCILGMTLGRSWNIGAWLGVSTGGLLGALIPWAWLLPSGSRGVSGAQVQLEQAAGVLSRMQHRLLEMPGRALPETDRMDRLKSMACADCPREGSCAQKDAMDETVFTDPLSFSCPRTGRVLREAARLRERERLLEMQQRRREEYRMAVAQQYGMLSLYLRRVADGLPLHITVDQIRYRVSVSVRSREKGTVDGDRCAAFPGQGPRFYVLLCDGMGTGAAAAVEAMEGIRLLKGMLTAGLPPGLALRSLNAQLLLTGGSGAVTADLAEIRLDTGFVSLYKWGAAPSWLLGRHTVRPVGGPGLPPGVELGAAGERISRLSLRRGEYLVMATDGCVFDPPPEPQPEIRTTGDLAETLLTRTAAAEDDATLAVIRLGPLAG